MSTPTSLYRYFDADGELIYVGITTRGPQRQTEHNMTSEWWQFVRRQEVDHHPSREVALERERDLIKRHQPPFNRQHNVDHEAIKAAYLARRPALEPTSECSPCPGVICEWETWGVRVLGCGRLTCSHCHADWHGQQRTWEEAPAVEARDFLAYMIGRAECTNEEQANAAREILRLGTWLLEQTRAGAAKENDDLTWRRAAMLARHFQIGYASDAIEGVRF